MKTSAVKMEQVPIGQLVGYVNNARTHSKEQILQLRSSLREFGFVSPCLITSDYSVLAGHGRIEAAKAEGYETVPCVFVEGLSEAQRKAYILADNRLAMNAGWDEALLSIELTDLQGADFDISLLGFDGKELEKLLSDNKEADEDSFDVDAELDKPVFSKTGDIWTLGSHRVICGDSTKPETYVSLMQGKQANLIVTDPPYGIDYQGTAGKIKNDKFDSDEKFYTFLLDAFTSMAAALASDGAAYVFHADSKGLVFRRAFDEAGFKLSGCCIWAKNTFTLGRSDYQWCHEPCLYGWKKAGKHNWYGDRKQSTIWHCDKPSRSEKHPTMKPIPLLAIPIANSTQTNGVVLEPFAGSGSTLICCEQLGRVCYAIELDEKFVDVIVNRYIEAVGSADGVFVERGGKTLKYEEVVAL
jgi:DNA modification methylase